MNNPKPTFLEFLSMQIKKIKEEQNGQKKTDTQQNIQPIIPNNFDQNIQATQNQNNLNPNNFQQNQNPENFNPNNPQNLNQNAQNDPNKSN